MDALDGEILYVMDFAESRFPMNRFFSKDNKKNRDSEEALKDMEKNQIILDLKTIKPNPSYKIKNSPADYKIDLLKDRVPIDAAERMVLDEIAEEKKAKRE